MSTRMALRMGTIFAAVVLGFFALGSWMSEQGSPRPLNWHADYDDLLWTPLQQGTLTLAQVDAALASGELWMVSADGEPVLASRYPLESDGQMWRVQAVIKLDEQRTASLVQAQAWTPGMRDQPVSPAVAASLASQPVERMSMIPAEPVDVLRIQGTFGNPDVRMEVGEGNQAWVYSRAGVVAAVSDEEVHSIMFGLRGEQP